MALLRPIFGEVSLVAASVSALGVVFLVVKTVRAARMSASIDGHDLVIRDLWRSTTVDVRRVAGVRVAQRSGFEVTELDVERPDCTLQVLSWPPETAEELAGIISAAGGARSLFDWTDDGNVEASDEASDRSSSSVHPGVPGAELLLGDPEWQRLVYRTEHVPERTAMWAIGAIGLAVWWTTRVPFALLFVVVGVLGLAGLARRSRRIGIDSTDGGLCVRNLWSTRLVPPGEVIRVEMIGGRGSLLLEVHSTGGSTVVEAAPFGDAVGLAAVIERGGGAVEFDFDPLADPLTLALAVDSYWQRLWRVY